MEFAANLRYTLINTALTRFSPTPPPLNKVEVHKVYKICKRCLTCNTQHCSGGEGVNLNYIFLTQKAKCPKRFDQDCSFQFATQQESFKSASFLNLVTIILQYLAQLPSAYGYSAL